MLLSMYVVLSGGSKDQKQLCSSVIGLGNIHSDLGPESLQPTES